MKRLRTVLLYTTGHLGSAVVFSGIAEAPEFEIVGVVKASALGFSRAGWKRLKKHLRRVGWRFGWLFFWQQVWQTIAYGLGRALPFARAKVRPARVLARELGVPVFRARSVNDASCREFLTSLAPDLLVSAYFTQILKDEVIAIPRLGTLNVHPGWLPAYRGAMAYFWTLRNGEDSGGVTVHWIDRGIDTGEILARRAFRIAPGATQQRVLVKTAIIGVRLLRRIARELRLSKRPAPLSRIPAEARYYAVPGAADFDAYFRKRRFFRIRDLLGLLLKRRQ